MIEVVVLAEDIKSCLVAIERHENQSVIIINFTRSNQCFSSVLHCVSDFFLLGSSLLGPGVVSLLIFAKQ